MQRILLMTCLCAPLVVACGGSENDAHGTTHPMTTSDVGTLQVHAQPVFEDVHRLGVNLGQWSYWGAEQLGRNILMNPGFEGVIDRTLVRVTAPGNSSFSDDQTWLGRHDGFWAQAEYRVLTGVAASASGYLIDSLQRGRHGLPEYFPRRVERNLAEGDIVALTRITDTEPPYNWWFSGSDTGRFLPDSVKVRPGSPGIRSLRIEPQTGQTATLSSHLDTITDRAGKLLPVQGTWLFSTWIYGDAEHDAELSILFRRHGSAPFFELQIQPSSGWQRIEHHFEALDIGPAGALEFRVEVRGGPVWIDDVWLGPQQAGFNPLSDTARGSHLNFAPEVIARLQQLQPGYLRDWQGQLGDTLENRLASPFARRSSRYRPAANPFYLYGLEDFLALNHHIGSRPWVVMPTTFSTEEARTLGTWLAHRIQDYNFDEVLVEFGNENWNSLFRPAGIQDPRHHGEAADKAFAALLEGAGHHPALRTVINAQHANPDAALSFNRHSRVADIIAIAPYVMHRLEEVSQEEMLKTVFSDDGNRMKTIADALNPPRQLAVYEVNLHVTGGNASEATRNALVSSPAAGAALAKRMIEAMQAGATRQSLYRLTGFDTPVNDGNGLVRLFGLSANLHDPEALRPSGWAMVMLNRAIQPRLHAAVFAEGAVPDQITVAAFSGESAWSAALVSSSSTPQAVTLVFPDDGRALPSQGDVLDGLPVRFDGQERQLTPKPAQWEQTGGRSVAVTIPAYGLVTLTP